MLLTSVIIVLREVLEAALLVSILSALSGIMGISRQWLLWAFACGFAGAVSYGLGIDTVSDLFDGTGQELSSAAMQFLIYLLLIIFAFLAAAFCQRSWWAWSIHRHRHGRHHRAGNYP